LSYDPSTRRDTQEGGYRLLILPHTTHHKQRQLYSISEREIDLLIIGTHDFSLLKACPHSYMKQ
jgi:hypothetical protein